MLEDLTDFEVINKVFEYWEILLKKVLRNYPAVKAFVQIILDTGKSMGRGIWSTSIHLSTRVQFCRFRRWCSKCWSWGSHCTQLVISKQRDTYFAIENLEVTEIEGMEGVEDCKVLAPELVKHCYEIRFKESHPSLNHLGDENWKVRCKCGATVDDGHRMIACDICGVWHHTRCNDIDDKMASPKTFTCDICVENI